MLSNLLSFIGSFISAVCLSCLLLLQNLTFYVKSFNLGFMIFNNFILKLYIVIFVVVFNFFVSVFVFFFLTAAVVGYGLLIFFVCAYVHVRSLVVAIDVVVYYNKLLENITGVVVVIKLYKTDNKTIKYGQ